MQYQQTLDFLFSQLPMYQRIGEAAYKKDLTNTIELCEALGNPQQNFRSVLIAGTNGKGSVSNMLASVLQEQGYRTGLYTSPHLVDFRERIRLNGVLCEKQFVIDFTEKIKPLIKTIEPSFFEITVAMAFEYFSQQQVDIAVVEVGLGGRLDSTNILTPLLSVITNISFDHMHMLGNTLPEIAGEKAGIIKTGIPVVIGEYHEESFPVFLAKAAEEASDIYLAEQNFDLTVIRHSLDELVVNASYMQQLIYENLKCDLTGVYQLKNIKTVLQSIELLRTHIDISEDAVYQGLEHSMVNTGFAGRLQILSKQPLILCDCAHNSAGLHALFGQIKGQQYSTLRIVTGMVRDKDPDLNLAEFPDDAVYYFCKPDIPRGMDASALMLAAGAFGLKGTEFDTVAEAVMAAVSQTGKDDIILICGSIFVVAEALQIQL